MSKHRAPTVSAKLAVGIMDKFMFEPMDNKLRQSIREAFEGVNFKKIHIRFKPAENKITVYCTTVNKRLRIETSSKAYTLDVGDYHGMV
jgi:hypothetical protein